jgi:hypothetical protein
MKLSNNGQRKVLMGWGQAKERPPPHSFAEEDTEDGEDMRSDGKCAGFEETYGDSALCKCGHTFHVHDEETDMCRICPPAPHGEPVV